MNRFCILIAALSFSIAAKGQGLTTSQNYILTTTYTAADGVGKIQDIDYYDGLGAIRQKISIGASPGGESILTPIQYDAMRRQSQQYLPYAVSGSGTYVAPQAAISAQKAFYNAKYGDNNGYSYTESVYEASPLNRVNEAWNVGNVYRVNDKKSKFTYETNMPNEVMWFKVNGSGLLVRSGFHIANTLYKSSVTNEDGTTTCKYTDNLDHVVMERIIGGSTNHDTYYVYDNRGNLCYVLPPKLVDIKTPTNASLSDTDSDMVALAYIYKYDERNRCVEKHLPGTESIYMIYDKGDRLVLTQDGKMRPDNRWVYTKYDNLNRVVSQSIVSGASNRSTIQSLFNSTTNYLLDSDSRFSKVVVLVENKYGKAI